MPAQKWYHGLWALFLFITKTEISLIKKIALLIHQSRGQSDGAAGAHNFSASCPNLLSKFSGICFICNQSSLKPRNPNPGFSGSTRWFEFSTRMPPWNGRLLRLKVQSRSALVMFSSPHPGWLRRSRRCWSPQPYSQACIQSPPPRRWH